MRVEGIRNKMIAPVRLVVATAPVTPKAKTKTNPPPPEKLKDKRG